MTRSRKVVAAFDTTSDAMLAEALCKEHHIAGRLIPIPTDISAGCGLAFMMPPEEEEHFKTVVEGRLTPSGYYERELRG